jgi:two-component system, OmpR family, sensor histidine kinase MprB
MPELSETGEDVVSRNDPSPIARMTFRTRLVLITTIATALTAIVVAFFGYGLARRSVLSAVDSALRDDQQRYARRFANSGQGIGIKQESETAPVALVNGVGKLLRYTEAASVSVDPIDFKIARGNSAAFTNRVIDGVPFRFFTSPIAQRLNNQGRLAAMARQNGGPGLAILVGRNVAQTNKQLATLKFGFGFLGLLGTAVSAVAAALTVRFGTRQLKRLTIVAEEIAARDEGTILAPESGPPELAQLGKSFNRMLHSLRSTRMSQQRMIDDAAHELRTPLTSLQTNVELLLRAPHYDESTRRDITLSLKEQVLELRTLVDDLGLLAEPNSAENTPGELVDFAEIVEVAVQRAQRRTAEITIETSLNEFTIVAHRDRLERAIVNILDNAVKWSPANSTIYVRLQNGSLTVDDAGPGIAPDDRQRAFDRFWRSDATRQTPGSGLGLAIVYEVVAEHGGTAHLGDSDAGGTRVTMHLPHAPLHNFPSDTDRNARPVAIEPADPEHNLLRIPSECGLETSS